MPEWAKVLAGIVTLIIVGCIPAFILTGLHLRQHHPPEIQRASKQDPANATYQQNQSGAIDNPTGRYIPVIPSNAAQDQQLKSGDQTDGGEQEPKEFFVVFGYKFKITDFAVAVFTGLLVWVGAHQARKLHQTMIATKASADALPNLERAYIFIEIHPHFSGNVESSLRRLDRSLNIEYQFTNYGKTPAIISGINVEFHHWTQLPQIRYIDEALPSEIVLPANEIYPDPIILVPTRAKAFISETTGVAPQTHLYFQGKRELTEPLDAEAIRSIQEGRSFLWFYGHIVYSDVFGKPHETRFCWIYNGLAKSFHQYNRGNENLNCRT